MDPANTLDMVGATNLIPGPNLHRNWPCIAAIIEAVLPDISCRTLLLLFLLTILTVDFSRNSTPEYGKVPHRAFLV